MLTAKYFYLVAKYIQFKLSAQMLTITYASLFLFVAFSGWGLANLTTVMLVVGIVAIKQTKRENEADSNEFDG